LLILGSDDQETIEEAFEKGQTAVETSKGELDFDEDLKQIEGEAPITYSIRVKDRELAKKIRKTIKKAN
jgi:hypothetical protein